MPAEEPYLRLRAMTIGCGWPHPPVFFILTAQSGGLSCAAFLSGGSIRSVLPGTPFGLPGCRVALCVLPMAAKRGTVVGLSRSKAPVISLAASPNFHRDRVVLAGTDGDGILRSTDGGRHWQLSNFGLRDYAIFDLAVAPVWERYEYAFAVTEGGLYQSPNGGRAWRRANLGDISRQPSIVAVSPEFAADRTVFAGCETGELLISTDAGRSYNLAAAGFEAITALTFTPQGSLLLGTAEGICRIEGKELKSDTDLRGNGPPNLPTRPLEDGEGAIRTQHDAMPDFSSGPPAEGLSTSSKPLASVLTLSAVEGSLYAGLADGLYQSAEDGRSWQFISGLSAGALCGASPRPLICGWLAGRKKAFGVPTVPMEPRFHGNR